MQLTKANLSLHQATLNPLPRIEGLDLDYLRVDPYKGTVIASDGHSLYESRTQIPIAGYTRPFFIHTNNAKKAQKNLNVRNPHVFAELNPAEQTVTIKSYQGHDQSVLPDNRAIAWPDFQKVITSIRSGAPKTDVMVSVEMLERLVNTFGQHPVDHVTMQLIDPISPIVFKSQADAGDTLTAFIMPCNDNMCPF